jgi:hypothetical protein
MHIPLNDNEETCQPIREEWLEGQDDDFGLALEPGDAFLGHTIRGVFVDQLIDEGGMGRVYSGMQLELGVPVAVKVIRPELLSAAALSRFQSEMRLLARLEHVGIPRIKFADVWDGQPYFVMDFISGGRDVITFANEKQLTIPQRLELFQQVCEAVGFGHLAGVIHRDLKPRNILVDGSGQPKVIDFGIAHLQAQSESIDDDVACVRQPGSPAYMSPEQWGCRNAGKADVRTDVYSLGVVLYELLAGQKPYRIAPVSGVEERQAAVRAATCHQEPMPLRVFVPGVPEDVWSITACCLAKDPDARYTNARELAQDVARFLRGDPVRANPPGPLRIVGHLVSRHRMAAVAMLTAVGVLAATLGWAAYQRGRVDEARMEELSRWLVGFDSIDRILVDMRDRVQLLIPDDHERAIRMLRIIADHQGRLGLWSQAAVTLREAVQRLKKLPHVRMDFETHYQVQSDLVRAHLQSEEQESVLDDATALVEWLARHDEPDPGRRLDALGMQAIACRRAGQLSEARKIGMLIVPQLVELRGDSHVETLQARNNLAVVNRRAGSYDRAHEELREIHDLAVQSLGAKHPETLKFAHNLAIAKLSLGLQDEAEKILETTWEARRMKYGDRHPATISTLTELFRIQERRGDAPGVVRRLQTLEPSLLEVVADSEGQVDSSCVRLLRIGRWAFEQIGDASHAAEIDVMLMSAEQDLLVSRRVP